MQFSVIYMIVPFPEPYAGNPCNSDVERLKHLALFIKLFCPSLILSDNSQVRALFGFDILPFFPSAYVKV